MLVVYDCHISEVMGYPERNIRFRRGDDVFLMWDGYFHSLMRTLWPRYAYEPDPDFPDELDLDKVPILRSWNERGSHFGEPAEPVGNLPATAQAIREAAAELRQTPGHLRDSPTHGEALAEFLEQAAARGAEVSVEGFW